MKKLEIIVVGSGSQDIRHVLLECLGREVRMDGVFVREVRMGGIFVIEKQETPDLSLLLKEMHLVRAIPVNQVRPKKARKTSRFDNRRLKSLKPNRMAQIRLPQKRGNR